MTVGRLTIGLLLIVIGVLFLLDALDAPGVDAWAVIRQGWPVAIIAVGVSQALEQRRLGTGPVIVMLVGLILLAVTLDIVPVGFEIVIPVLLVAIGLVLLLRRQGLKEVSAVSDARLASTAVFGGRELRSRSKQFSGAALVAVFGGVDLDLTEAELNEDGAVVDLTIIFGGAEVIVPNSWRVDVHGTAVFGEIDDQTRLEATLPADAPTLAIKGLCLFGGAEVRNP